MAPASRTAARPPDAHLLIVENVLNAPGRTPAQQRYVHVVDLHMLVMFGGGSGRRRSMTRSWSQPVSPRPWSNPRRIPGTFSERSRG